MTVVSPCKALVLRRNPSCSAGWSASGRPGGRWHTCVVCPPPPFLWCCALLLLAGQSGCWAGASLVMVKDESSGQGVPTPISTVTIGQSILCFEGGAHLGDDVREPGTPRWCKVTAWVSL